MRFLTALGAFFLIFHSSLSAQVVSTGTIMGSIVDSKQQALESASIRLVFLSDSSIRRGGVTDKQGVFHFSDLPFGYYRLTVSGIGYQPFIMDSIWIRSERTEINLQDLVIRNSSDALQEVIVYAEKPLIQSNGGNITMNASESPLASGGSATDLLKQLPLVAIDPNGGISVKGKEPKILIDDKPVDMNAQQLQDFLESMPGSMIERIEVMTNPPPQYANEPGGVINIITKKGKMGRSGRLSITGGSRGERAGSGSFSLRKKGFNFNLNSGWNDNDYSGYGYSKRQNIYSDSVTYFNTNSAYSNNTKRPSIRVALDVTVNTHHSVNIVLQYNENRYNNQSNIGFLGLTQLKQVSSWSERKLHSWGNNRTPIANLTYTFKGAVPTTSFRIWTGYQYSDNRDHKNWFQEFLNTDGTKSGLDSTQFQQTISFNTNWYFNTLYDKMLVKDKTFMAIGAQYLFAYNDVDQLSSTLKKPDSVFVKNDLLSTTFNFSQAIKQFRFSLRQLYAKTGTITAGINVEETTIDFNVVSQQKKSSNTYWTPLPFITVQYNWKEKWNAAFTYRRVISRPGIGQLNPAIDYTDPYNLRFGNTSLKPTTSHNFDASFGIGTPVFYANIGMGYHLVQDVFTQIRTLQPDGKTFVSWQNIDDRNEWVISTWNGYNFSKKWRANWSASYTYNLYSAADKLLLKYRDGGSFNTNTNVNFTASEKFNSYLNFTVNRFANPQGYVRWNSSMSVGAQYKFLKKKLIVSVNVIDPVQQQINRTSTAGINFLHESYGYNRTGNYRLSLTYNFTQSNKKINKYLPSKK
ncbi:MAG: TonB-dependent receptor [Chitinophagaceae bacterium]|nr:TonB-dependent receptor [Chitinophagaceae bacterium]